MIFVTGTDTNVGKTLVSALLCRALDAGYWKPVQSGTIDGTDRETVRELTGLPNNYFYSESYSLTQPLSPHAAAAIDGVNIVLSEIRLPDFKQKAVVVEGAGGVFVPLNESSFVIDLIQQLSLPTIVVARSGLGTINHSVLTLNALRAAGIEVLGVITNGEKNPGNKSAIEQYGKTKVLFHVDPISEVTTSSITKISEHLRNELYNHLPYLASIHTNENVRYAASGEAR